MTAPERVWIYVDTDDDGERYLELIHEHAHSQTDVEYVRADVSAARIADLERQLADARTDAEQAVAVAYQRAASEAEPWCGPPVKSNIVNAQSIAAQQIKARILALSPAEPLAEVERMRAERDALQHFNRQLRDEITEYQTIRDDLAAEVERMRQQIEAVCRAHMVSAERCVALEDRAEAAEAEVERLTALLVSDREEILWNAYRTGHEKDGQWDHCCMSDGEWLARECGFEAGQRVYPADAIKGAIPGVAARAALQPTQGDAG